MRTTKKGKTMAVAITRTLSRPRFSQFDKALASAPSWKDSPANLYVAVHGKGDLEDYNGVPVLDFRKESVGEISHLNYLVLRKLSDRGFDYIGVMDDDAYFREPESSLALIRHVFRIDPKAAYAGPWHSFYAYKQLGEEAKTTTHRLIQQAPWTCYGCQIYRRKWLRHLPLNYMLKLHFCMDLGSVMLFNALGLNCYEFNVPFVHRMSQGQGKGEQTREGILQKHQWIEDDFTFIGKYLYERCGQNATTDKLNATLRRLLTTNERRTEKLLAQL